MVPPGLRGMFRHAAVALLVLAVPAGAVGGAVVPTEGFDATDARESNLAAIAEGPASQAAANNSTTVQQRDPDAVDEPGELADLQRWFAGHLADRLGNSTIQLDRGEYERARSLLGDEYGEALSKYVDLAGETDAEDDDAVAREFESAREHQREYVDAVSEYRETRERYREARRDGDEARARELARQLGRLGERVERAGANLTDSYAAITNGTDADLAPASETVDATTRNVSATQTAIENETFVRTALTVAVESDSASFRDPVRVTGRLTAADGTSLGDRHVTVGFGSRTTAVQTDEDGSFAATVRPTVVGLGNRSLEARYVPRNDSVYLGSSGTVAVNVTQVAPTVSVSESTESVGFGNTVVIEGRVHVDDVGAGGVPVRVAVAGQVLGTTRTDADGTLRFERALPAWVPAGDHEVTVAVALDDRALGPATTTRAIEIAPTATRLELEASETETGKWRLAGRLTTASGTPLANRTVALDVGDSTVATATTNASGEYAATVNESALASAGDGATVTVVATYAGTGNLNSSRARTTIRVQQVQQVGEERGLWDALPGPPWALPAGVVAVGALAVLALRRVGPFGRSGESGDGSSPTGTSAGDTGPNASDSETGAGVAATAPSETFLERAQTLLDSGATDDAVSAAYAAMRERATALLDGEAGDVETRTHWEFYRACADSDALTDDQVAAVESVTGAFEQMRYSPGAVAADVAADAVESAVEFASDGTDRERGARADD